MKTNLLKKDDTIAIVSLSSGILGESFCTHQLDLGIKRINELGLKVKIMPNALKGIEYLKNNPLQRANDLKDAFLDKDVKAIICAIGGNDAYRLAPYLINDEEFLKAVKETPKIFIGFSDTTHNHLFLNKLGVSTYYGQAFLTDIAELGDQMLAYTLNSFMQIFNEMYQKEINIESSKYWFKERIDFSINSLGSNRKKNIEENGFVFFNQKKDLVKGQLTGGCLESLFQIYADESCYESYRRNGLLPTKDHFNDKVAFIETAETKSSPEMFLQMLEKLADEMGLLKSKAIIVGKPADEAYFNEYLTILKEVSEKHNIPVVYNLNFGHALPRMLIPYNAKIKIDFKRCNISINN